MMGLFPWWKENIDNLTSLEVLENSFYFCFFMCCIFYGAWLYANFNFALLVEREFPSAMWCDCHSPSIRL